MRLVLTFARAHEQRSPLSDKKGEQGAPSRGRRPEVSKSEVGDQRKSKTSRRRQGHGVTSQAALAQFATVTDAKQRPGFPIAADLKRS